MEEIILAKSPIQGRQPKTLLCHTKDIMASVELLYGHANSPTRLAREWLRFFRLKNEDYECFLMNALGRGGFSRSWQSE